MRILSNNNGELKPVSDLDPEKKNQINDIVEQVNINQPFDQDKQELTEETANQLSSSIQNMHSHLDFKSNNPKQMYINNRIRKTLEKIESNMIDEQDTRIKHASNNTTVVIMNDGSTLMGDIPFGNGFGLLDLLGMIGNAIFGGGALYTLKKIKDIFKKSNKNGKGGKGGKTSTKTKTTTNTNLPKDEKVAPKTKEEVRTRKLDQLKKLKGKAKKIVISGVKALGKTFAFITPVIIAWDFFKREDIEKEAASLLGMDESLITKKRKEHLANYVTAGNIFNDTFAWPITTILEWFIDKDYDYDSMLRKNYIQKYFVDSYDIAMDIPNNFKNESKEYQVSFLWDYLRVVLHNLVNDKNAQDKIDGIILDYYMKQYNTNILKNAQTYQVVNDAYMRGNDDATAKYLMETGAPGASPIVDDNFNFTFLGKHRYDTVNFDEFVKYDKESQAIFYDLLKEYDINPEDLKKLKEILDSDFAGKKNFKTTGLEPLLNELNKQIEEIDKQLANLDKNSVLYESLNRVKLSLLQYIDTNIYKRDTVPDNNGSSSTNVPVVPTKTSEINSQSTSVISVSNPNTVRTVEFNSTTPGVQSDAFNALFPTQEVKNVDSRVSKLAREITEGVPGTKGFCARAVSNALERAGFRTPHIKHRVDGGEGRPDACQYYRGGFLQTMGFGEIPRPKKFKMGDILVIDGFDKESGNRKRRFGHIAVFNGKNWVSDFIQNSPDGNVYPDTPRNKMHYFRYGEGNRTLTKEQQLARIRMYDDKGMIAEGVPTRSVIDSLNQHVADTNGASGPTNRNIQTNGNVETKDTTPELALEKSKDSISPEQYRVQKKTLENQQVISAEIDKTKADMSAQENTNALLANEAYKQNAMIQQQNQTFQQLANNIASVNISPILQQTKDGENMSPLDIFQMRPYDA